MTPQKPYDVIIVGGSYAGLSAALALGRSLRDVLILDHNNPCNRQTPHSHNFLTRDGQTPAALAETARREVLQYPTVTLKPGKAVQAHAQALGFEVQLENGEKAADRKLLLATGLTDVLPSVPGLAECWGISVLHCPYCHGYEVAGQEWGIIGNGEEAFHYSRLLHNWAKSLVLFTNGPCLIEPEQRQKLEEKGVRIVEQPLQSVLHTDGHVRQVQLADCSSYPLSVIFMRAPFRQQSDLCAQLGCAFTEAGHIRIDDMQRTTVTGVFASGDNSHRMRSVSAAVASGTMAGTAINLELVNDSF